MELSAQNNNVFFLHRLAYKNSGLKGVWKYMVLKKWNGPVTAWKSDEIVQKCFVYSETLQILFKLSSKDVCARIQKYFSKRKSKKNTIPIIIKTNYRTCFTYLPRSFFLNSL